MGENPRHPEKQFCSDALLCRTLKIRSPFRPLPRDHDQFHISLGSTLTVAAKKIDTDTNPGGGYKFKNC